MRQAGFTLVEIAVVLVITGLLLGGILKGTELINSAKVKALAGDFRAVPTYLHAYQDKYRALPGDDARATASLGPAATQATTPAAAQGNGMIDGRWDSAVATDESYLTWQHLRLAQLAPRSPNPADPTYGPRNAVGGHLGLSSASVADLQIAGMTGSFQVCSSGILGSFVQQLDVHLDDGEPCSGSLRAVPDGAAPGAAAARTAGAPAACAGPLLAPALKYTVCMTF